MSNETPRKTEGSWAAPVARLVVESAPAGAINLNVHGKRVAGALQGFGTLWQKAYRVRLEGSDVTPADVVRTWRENFASFWPAGNQFYAPLVRIESGEVALLNLSMPGGVRLSTGVMVIYVDEESFSFMTPEGHMFAGWITFSAFTAADSVTVAQVHVLIRASDPLYEIGFRLGGSRQEDRFWEQTLLGLAAHFGVQGRVTLEATCLDPRLQWPYARNIWHNAGIRSVLYRLAAPARWLRKDRQP